MVHPVFDAPCWPLDAPIARFGVFRSQTGTAGRERTPKAEMRPESARSGAWRNRAPETASTPITPATRDFFLTFLGTWPTATPTLIAHSWMWWQENHDAGSE